MKHMVLHILSDMKLPLLLSAMVLSAGCAQQGEPTVDEAQAALASETQNATADAASAAPMELAEAPKAALVQLQNASKNGPIAVFKHSPICPISAAAHEEFYAWKGGEDGADVQFAHIDVLGEKPLARGLVAELGVKHESPQLLLFNEGELVWHASHGAITEEALKKQLLLIEP